MEMTRCAVPQFTFLLYLWANITQLCIQNNSLHKFKIITENHSYREGVINNNSKCVREKDERKENEISKTINQLPISRKTIIEIANIIQKLIIKNCLDAFCHLQVMHVNDYFGVFGVTLFSCPKFNLIWF